MKRRIEIQKIVTGVVVAAVVLSGALQTRASVVNVFLDDGASAPGSSNTSAPYSIGTTDSTWDVLASAENGMTAVGAAVMEVRMVTFNVNGDLRSAGHNTFGLGVTTGSNSGWFDGNSQEAALFQLAFYSDAAKTTEITGLDITFKSLLSRNVPYEANRSVTAYAGSGTLTTDGSAAFLNGTKISSVNDSSLYNTAEAGLGTGTVSGQYVTIPANDTVVFGEADSFWLRRKNLSGAADAAYQLGAVTFDVVPEPATFGLVALVGGGLLLIRRRRFMF